MMSLTPGTSKAWVVSPSAGTFMPPLPELGRPFFAPVYGNCAVHEAAPGWLGLNEQACWICLFPFMTLIDLLNA